MTRLLPPFFLAAAGGQLDAPATTLVGESRFFPSLSIATSAAILSEGGMSMAPAGQPLVPEGWFPLTYDDYLELPDDGRRYQILEGELDVTPAPTVTHQKVSMLLELLLAGHVLEHDLGLVLDAPVDVLLDPQNVVQPDIIFVANARLSIVEEKRIAGAPDLVVEILSPGTGRVDRLVKTRLYASFGVSWLWLVDPAEQLLEEYERVGMGYRPTARCQGEESFAPRLFPGLTIPLPGIFRR